MINTKRFSAVLATVLFMTSFHAKAYDEDTHFYGTYAMARYAGIKHEVASKLALSAQWMDESYISDPTSMIILFVDGIKKRRLLHFPSSRIVGKLNGATQKSAMGVDDALAGVDLQKIEAQAQKYLEMWFRGEAKKKKGAEVPEADAVAIMSETEESHAFATELLMEGLKEGNLMKAGASLHTLEDSFAHAGTPAEQGHAAFWHWPDRPFASVEKYKRMTKSVFAALVAIRSQLPESQLDCSLKTSNTIANCQMTAAQLSAEYTNNQKVMATVSKDVLQEPAYIQVALADVLTKGTHDVTYFKLSNEQVKSLTSLQRITSIVEAQKKEGKVPSAYTVLEATLKELIRKTDSIDLNEILDDMRKRKSDSAMAVMTYMDSYGDGSDKECILNMEPESFEKFVRALSVDMLRWNVPRPLTDSHRMELEDDKSNTRKKEMEMRVAGMRALIKDLYGTDIEFVENTTKNDIGFGKEIRMDADAEAKLTAANQVTFTLKEKNAFDNMVFRYLVPDLDEADLLNIVAAIHDLKAMAPIWKEYMQKRTLINESGSNWFVKKGKLIGLDAQYLVKLGTEFVNQGKHFRGRLLPIAGTYYLNLIETHMSPSEDNFYYQNSRLIGGYREKGITKSFMSNQNAWWLGQGQKLINITSSFDKTKVNLDANAKTVDMPEVDHMGNATGRRIQVRVSVEK